MIRGVFIAVILVVLAGLVVGAWWGLQRGIPVQAATVQEGPIREFVDERGKTRLPVTHRITMPFGGRVMQIDLPEGTPVSVGQVVARVDPVELQNELDEALAAVERLAAQIVENNDSTVEQVAVMQAEKLTESMKHTVEAADQRKVAGLKRRDVTEKSLARIARLFREEVETEEKLDEAELAQVEGDIDYRQDVLVWQALQAMEAATSFLPDMIQKYIKRKDNTQAVLEKQMAEAEARLRQAELRLQRGQLTSPVSGVVLKRPIINEQFLAAGTVLLEIGRQEELEVEAEILSHDVVRIQEGDEVEIYGPAIGKPEGQGVRGEVRRIYPSGFTKISSLGVEQQRVMVIVAFAPGVLQPLLERELGVDYRVRVRIFTQTRQQALIVPRSAIFCAPDGGWQLFAIRNQRAVLQAAEAGLMNDQSVQILSGVGVGEQVVLAPESNLPAGARVHVTPRR